YNKMALVKKGTQYADNAWFVGYAPKRNPEIVVSVLVQESGQHGGEAAGPVVRDIVKGYYDKKNKKLEGTTVTASDTKPAEPAKAAPAPATTPTVQPVARRQKQQQPPREKPEIVAPASAQNDPSAQTSPN